MASTIQRKFTKLTVKGGGNDAKIQVVLDDFDIADKTIAQLVDSLKHWRTSWTNILNGSVGIAKEFEELYNPIIGATDGHSRGNDESSEQQLHRTKSLRMVYDELKKDMSEELTSMETRIIKPAEDAREYIKPLRKIIKSQDDKRLDFERYQDRVNKAAKKENKTERENMTFQKSQDDLARAAEVLQRANDELHETIPPIIAACFSILPHLLAAQINAQNTMLAHYYTVLSGFCSQHSFESPPPSLHEVVAIWESHFKPIHNEVESMDMIRKGEAVRKPMTLGSEQPKTVSGLNLRNTLKSRTSSGRVPGLSSPTTPSPGRPRPVSRISSSTSIVKIPSSSSRRGEYEGSENQSGMLQANFASRAPSGPSDDYFQIKPMRSSSSSASTPAATPGKTLQSRASPSDIASIAEKKKKPPPPPPKRMTSGIKETWVMAIYGFEGQEEGDLSFQEGEKIRVIKKTGSTDDWWEGEVRGRRGKFPANYCELVA